MEVGLGITVHLTGPERALQDECASHRQDFRVVSAMELNMEAAQAGTALLAPCRLELGLHLGAAHRRSEDPSSQGPSSALQDI